MKIAVFEDNPSDAQNIRDICFQWGRSRRCTVKLWLFPSTKILDDELNDHQRYDFFFLDIMTSEDPSAGFRLAERIRRSDNRTPVVFTTNSREYIESAFEISAFQYLLKPLDEEKVFRALDRGFREMIRQDEDAGEFNSQNKRLHLSYSRILYIESLARNHHAILHMTDGAEHDIIISNMSFKAFISEILPDQFAQCHKSYAVNLEYVTGYSKKSVSLSFEEQIPVGNDFYQNLVAGIIRKQANVVPPSEEEAYNGLDNI